MALLNRLPIYFYLSEKDRLTFGYFYIIFSEQSPSFTIPHNKKVGYPVLPGRLFCLQKSPNIVHSGFSGTNQ